MLNQARHRTSTPWGESQDARTLAPGIVFHSTASHGGYHLAPERLAAMPRALRAINTWAGGPWYEEDCDWAIVALAFPDLFSDYDLMGAVDTVHFSKPEGGGEHAAVAWLRHDARGQELARRVSSWRTANGHLFRTGSASTGGKGWTVSAERIDGGERLTIYFDEAHQRGYYDLHNPFAIERIAELGGVIARRLTTA